MPNKHMYTNRLIHQKSPYLLQHAHNPVDWYPWGEEAFQAARDLDKPIFLSIGYATCHWCHVMERECFENAELAEMLNETFINVKVDREELPEVDNLYMEFAQSMMSGAAGWPLNVVLTPSLQPFFAATYLPPEGEHGLVGLRDLIARIKDVWYGEERETVISQAEKIVEVFEQNILLQGESLPKKEAVEDVIELLFKIADPVYGGMRGAPKFPIGYQITLLLDYSCTANDSRGLFLAERTLQMMHRGGIYDHLGGGFARYSVDEFWQIPHFEKMLYDNALLAECYLEAWQMNKQPVFREVCEGILDYVLRDMSHEQGGYYSAQDAETEGKEGFFWTWTPKEIKHILGQKEGELFCNFFNVTEAGNFEGRNVLYITLPPGEFADLKGIEPKAFEERIKQQKQILWKEREKRKHPFKDDKIITSWNGLMIHSMASAGLALKDDRYIKSAVAAAKFIKTYLWEKGRLFRRWREGEAAFHAGLDDYACLIRGAITLFEVTKEARWLEWSIELAHILEVQFKSEDGAFYQTDGFDRSIVLRKCQFSDGAEPSGNAIHCENLLRLYQITQNRMYLTQAEDILKAVNVLLDQQSVGYCYHVVNINRFYDKSAPTIVISVNDQREHEMSLMEEIYSRFIPNKAVIVHHSSDVLMASLIPMLKEMPSIDGKTTLYICRQGGCQKPLTSYEEMRSAIQRL